MNTLRDRKCVLFLRTYISILIPNHPSHIILKIFTRIPGMLVAIKIAVCRSESSNHLPVLQCSFSKLSVIIGCIPIPSGIRIELTKVFLLQWFG